MKIYNDLKPILIFLKRLNFFVHFVKLEHLPMNNCLNCFFLESDSENLMTITEIFVTIIYFSASLNGTPAFIPGLRHICFYLYLKNINYTVDCYIKQEFTFQAI